jgi:hypothetical protein
VLAPVGVIAMLPEAVSGPSDQCRHIQFENEACRIERRASPRRGVAAHPTCHSSHKHALAINVERWPRWSDTMITESLGYRITASNRVRAPPLSIPLIFSCGASPWYRAFNAQFSERR